MLCLNRKVGEAVVIGDIRIVVHRMTGNQVTLAFQAPDNVQILRAELVPTTTTKPKGE
jgi:carbon storage regulator CsrA